MTFYGEDLSYDTQHKLLRFQTEDEGSIVPCAVSKAALVLIEDDAMAGPEAMATTYRRNRRRIHELAIRKYHEHRLEDDGVVVVRAFDLQT